LCDPWRCVMLRACAAVLLTVASLGCLERASGQEPPYVTIDSVKKDGPIGMMKAWVITYSGTIKKLGDLKNGFEKWGSLTLECKKTGASKALRVNKCSKTNLTAAVRILHNLAHHGWAHCAMD
jgi:hypothetical protein